VFFHGLEALQNVVNYAGASRAVVRLEGTDSALEFSVADDGAGFDPETTRRGAGTANKADRFGGPRQDARGMVPSGANERSSPAASRPVESCYTSAVGNCDQRVPLARTARKSC
jgi:hypothetical protein